jgi:hypothetical protein
MDIDDNTGIVTLDEYELHNLLADALQNLIRSQLPELDGEIPMRVVIVPREPKGFSPEMVTEWEATITDLFQTIGTLDARYHDEAEYTCI